MFLYYTKRQYQLDKLINKIEHISIIRFFFLRFLQFKKIYNTEKEVNYFKLEENFNDNYNYYADKNIFLFGYWQSFKLIKNISDSDFQKIFPELFKKNSILINNKKIKDSDIALHIRRGDYFANKVKKIHGVVTLKYYKKSINFFKNKFSKKCNFFIFTDDTSFVKNNFKNFEYTLINSDNSISDFLKLSYFKNFIISNSTYGLLSSYISYRRGNNVKVICPKIWYSDIYTRDTELMFTDFTIIDN